METLHYMLNATIKKDSELKEFESGYSAFQVNVDSSGNLIKDSYQNNNSDHKNNKKILKGLNGESENIGITDDIESDVDQLIEALFYEDSEKHERLEILETILTDKEYRIRNINIQGYYDKNNLFQAVTSKDEKHNKKKRILPNERNYIAIGKYEVGKTFTRVNTIESKSLEKQILEEIEKIIKSK